MFNGLIKFLKSFIIHEHLMVVEDNDLNDKILINLGNNNIVTITKFVSELIDEPEEITNNVIVMYSQDGKELHYIGSIINKNQVDDMFNKLLKFEPNYVLLLNIFKKQSIFKKISFQERYVIRF